MGRKPKRDPRQRDGVLVLHKPSGPTSAGCLTDIKRQLGQRKIGHAGTLDPLAEGVLLVLLGQGTKLAPYLSEDSKTYSGEFRLGICTDTFDIQGKIIQETNVDVTPDQVREAVDAWQDLTEQDVPAYSAAKHNGKPLYSLARAGEEVPVKTKPVTIHAAELLDVTLPVAKFRVRCSTGTYVRSLVHSLGKRLGCGATLTALLREESRPFGLHQAHGLDDVLNDPEHFPEKVIPMAEALPHWPRHRLTPPMAELVKNGTWLPVADAPDQLLGGSPGDQALLLDNEGGPLALVEAKIQNGQLKWAILRGLWA
ncbi:tRNA pseudouridine55 synthase [Paucidesulfovibrio gracilis DSM 16080]|uniref:tRNA pseudouridine synthase B n=1 Tax=Paucidesulfovibrio gracilis DSM 16080 TaxID=1121449 RepID=A0A1T4XA32_9BACT|nr:tRNA pseudouridine(55) synthase TruB [Paucidesulfovibrio gracilis]SKA86460.1 tRNA pseudouridine55 synthase [Paucidesulfovibrio gracilis DSM 16080]